jgi:AcrR family transcriptional regulator
MSTPAPRLRRPERREQTRAALLEAAAELFAAQGFHATTLDAVADAAGLTKGAVYSNFSGKDDLMRALIEVRVKRDSALWLEAFALEGAARMQRIAAVASDSMHADPQWIALELQFHLYALRDERARETLRAHYAEVQRQIRLALEPLLKDSAAELEALGYGMPALSLGMGVLGQLSPAPRDAWRVLLERLMRLTAGSR